MKHYCSPSMSQKLFGRSETIVTLVSAEFSLSDAWSGTVIKQNYRYLCAKNGKPVLESWIGLRTVILTYGFFPSRRAALKMTLGWQSDF